VEKRAPSAAKAAIGAWVLTARLKPRPFKAISSWGAAGINSLAQRGKSRFLTVLSARFGMTTYDGSGCVGAPATARAYSGAFKPMGIEGLPRRASTRGRVLSEG
jgi:hypothetical protein